MSIEDFELKLSVYEQKLELLNKDLKPIKEEFESIIKDKSLPLEDRWELFCNTPDYLKETSIWMEDFDCVEVTCDESEPFYLSKYQTANTINMFECLLDSENQNLIDEFREEVLSKNLISFQVDW